jgi:biotin operon repressor
MDYLTYTERLEYIHDIIEKGYLNTPHQLTEKWGCSEKTVRRMINCLRLKGIDIKYNKSVKRYELNHN